METNRESVIGAVIGAAVGAALPGLSKLVLWLVAAIAVALVHRHLEHALEEKMGTVTTLMVVLLIGPVFTLLRGTMQSIFSFFYFFVTVAAGFVIGDMFATESDSNDES